MTLTQKSDVFRAQQNPARCKQTHLVHKGKGKKELQDNEVTHSGRMVGLLHECSYNTRQSRFHPLVSSGLCKSGFCAGLHLRANYILVSFDEYHPDKHYTWLPFPAAQCNPAVQQCNTQRGQRSAKLCSKESKLTLEWKIKIQITGQGKSPSRPDECCWILFG